MKQSTSMLEFLQNINPIGWFSLRIPNVTSVFGTVFMGVCIILFLFGFLVRSRLKGADRIKAWWLRQVSFACVFLGLAGVALLFMSFEQVRFLGSRVWYLIWVITLIVWLGSLIWYRVKRLAHAQHLTQVKAYKDPYLPRRRRK